MNRAIPNMTVLTPWRVVLLVTAVYLSITVPALVAHAIWLDEAQALLIGRDSGSMGDLLRNMHYEGHPLGWNLLLFGVTHLVWPGYASLKVIHLLITSGIVVLFLRLAPFSVGTKCLVLAGYYFLFEYNIISRSYAGGILCLFACSALMRDSRKHLVWMGLLLFVMCNIHLLFAFAATGIFAAMLPEVWKDRKGQVFIVLFLCGWVTLLLQVGGAMRVSGNIPGGRTWFTVHGMFLAAGAVVKGWLPLPDAAAGRFWNTSWVDGMGSLLRLGLGLFLFVLPAMVLKGAGRALVFYYTSLLLLLIFLVMTQRSGARFFGLAYLYFIAACWMAGRFGTRIDSQEETGRVDGEGIYGKGMDRIGMDKRGRGYMGWDLVRDGWGIVFLILLIQAGMGVYALVESYRRPFSGAARVIAMMQARGLDSHVVVVDGYNAGPALSAYLGRPVYYTDIDARGSFCRWELNYQPDARPPLPLSLGRSAYVQGLKEFVLVTNRADRPWYGGAGGGAYAFNMVGSVGGSMILSENYTVYDVIKRAP